MEPLVVDDLTKPGAIDGVMDFLAVRSQQYAAIEYKERHSTSAPRELMEKVFGKCLIDPEAV